MRVSLRKLHELFPNRRDFKPTFMNWVLHEYHVEKTGDYTYTLAMRPRVIAFILAAPFVFIFALIWRGLSAIPDLLKYFHDLSKPLRTDNIRMEEYVALTSKKVHDREQD